MTDVTETRYDARIRRYDDGYVEVQIDGKTAGCPGGYVECASRRALDWLENGETHPPDVCFGGDAGGGDE